MDNSEEQTKTKHITIIVQDWEKLAGQLWREGNEKFDSRETGWHAAMAMGHIMREIVNSPSYWEEGGEMVIEPGVLASRALEAYQEMQEHNLNMLAKFHDRLLELMSGGINGR